jgi:hypothetical protein
MKHTHGEGVLVFALVAAFYGCADPASRAAGPAISADVQAGSSPRSTSSVRERAALTKVARLVAVAMDNEPARQHLKRAMKAAPFREHKLQLTSFLRSRDGKALLARMAALNRADVAELFETLAAIRPLELYMPVAKHRESWNGNADVLVVSQLDEAEPIVAFDKKGVEVALDRAVAPTQPTLSIVPVETRFDQPMDASASKNARDQNGNAVGTLEPMTIKASSLIACLESCGDGGTSGGTVPWTIPPGLYLEFSRILDLKEPWIRGDPEIEVHIQGPNNVSAPTYGEDLSCSGEHAYDPRKVFNQNGGFWEGRVLLFAADETLAFVNRFNQGFHVLFWEDDNEPCILKLDTSVLTEILRSTALAFSTVAIKVVPSASPLIIAAAFLGTFFSSAGDWLLTNDDFVGAAVDQGSAGYYYPGNTHVIMNRTTLNGRATIVYRQ